MERKTFPAVVTKTDADQGIVSAVFAVFGNIDEGNDVVHPGAFAKTFAERGQKVLVLDQHQTDSIMRALGKPVSLRELERDDLPAEMKVQHPDATGGAEAEIQFLMDTPEGKGAFIRLKAGAVSEWSFGYDVLDADFSKATRDGEEITIRNLRTLKLYEVSPVLWGMNQATLTTGAKSAEPTEGKPWGIVPQGDEFCVYRLDAEGGPTGETQGCHTTLEQAEAQIRALYASEEGEEAGKDTVMKTETDGKHPASHYLVVEDPQEVSTWHLRVRDVGGDLDHRLMGGAWAALHEGYRGNVYEGPGKQEAIAKLRRLYEQEDMEVPGKDFDPDTEVKAAVEALAEAYENIKAALSIFDNKQTPEDEKDQRAGPSGEAPTPDEGAGPPENETPTQSDKLARIQIARSQLDLLEV